MQQEDFIFEIKKFFPKNFCDKIIAYFGNDDLLDATTVGGLDKNVRNCIARDINHAKSFGQRIVQNHIKARMDDAVKHYIKNYTHVNVVKSSQIELLKYVHNQYKAGYKWHTDQGATVPDRQLSVSVCLNNDYDGGEFQFDFKEGVKQIPQNVGDLIIFPSNFMFPHQVKQVTRGIRYALIGWYI